MADPVAMQIEQGALSGSPPLHLLLAVPCVTLGGIYYDRTRARTPVLAYKSLRSTLAKRTWLTARSFRQQLTHMQKLMVAHYGEFCIPHCTLTPVARPKQFACEYVNAIHMHTGAFGHNCETV